MTIPFWREIQRQNFTVIEDLASFLHLDATNRSRVLSFSAFPLNLPRRLAEKIAKNTLDDPILRQFVPLVEESAPSQFLLDPVCDTSFRKSGKLLHKYEGRALMLVTSSCAMHCRFCFRRHFPYDKEVKGYEAELAQIQEDLSLREIILSGGDPLSLSNATLKELIVRLGNIPHLKRIRFHTRFPVGIPERIDEEFLEILAQSPLQIWFVLHSNHPRELDDKVLEALKRIGKLGIPLLCQTVLLKGINDDLETMKAFSEQLVDNGIVPYYLHQLDRVQGAEHFEVEEEKGKRLVEKLREVLSGYAVPQYVVEIPGKSAKTLLF